MKYLYLVLAAGCLALSPALADTAYPHAQSKSQAERTYLSSFWGKAQVSQAFIEVFFDSTATLGVNDASADVGSANISSNEIKGAANHQYVATVKVK